MKQKTIIIGILVFCFLIQPISAQTWNGTKRLTYNSGYSQAPVIDINSNNHIHMVWTDDTPGNWEVYHKKSTNGGSAWTTKRLTYNSGNTNTADIAIDSSNHLHIVWEDSNPGNREIFYKRSTDGGATWANKRLTYNSGGSYFPALATDSFDQIHVVWYDDTPGNGEIYYKRSTTAGSTWATKRLTYNSGNSAHPEMAVDSHDHIHVVWHDNTPGTAEIFLKTSKDGGATWANKRLTYNSGNSAIPTITVGSNSHIHVVWRDYTPGNHEIFYKKGIQ